MGTTDLTDYTFDQYIADMLALRRSLPESGQWPVEKWSPAKGRHRAPQAYRLAKKVKDGHGGVRVVEGNFWSTFEPEEDKGRPVIRV